MRKRYSYDDYSDDSVQFADPGGNSALRAASAAIPATFHVQRARLPIGSRLPTGRGAISATIAPTTRNVDTTVTERAK